MMRSDGRRRLRYWRSLAEYHGLPPTEEERVAEAAHGAAGPPEFPGDGVSRRRFLGLLGASAALAAGASCSRAERGTIVPYTKRPPEVVPGVANHYASTFQEGTSAFGVLVKVREGRPIHIEGNDEHPEFAGKTHLRAIADLLRLYDPDRLRRPLLYGKPATWAEADGRIVPLLRAAAASRGPVLLVTGAVVSPTRMAVLEDLRRVLPGLRHVAVEPLAGPGSRDAAVACFGEALTPRLRFDRADVILALESDFLGSDGQAPIAIREFVSRRRVEGRGDSMSRLWVLEAGMSVTGTNADHRLPVRPSASAAVAFALARALHEEHGIALPAGLSKEVLSAFGLDAIAGRVNAPRALLDALAADLAKAGRAALVVAGPSLPAEAHVASSLLNVMLGAEGHTVDAAAACRPAAGPATAEDLAAALREAKAGGVAAAIFWGVNPAYWLPDAALFKSAIARAPARIFIGLDRDETAEDCPIVLPEHHWLESWGDYETSEDLLSLEQPAIGPLYDTRQGEEILLGWAKALGAVVPAGYREYLKARWRREVYSAASPVPFESFWSAALHDGVLRRPAAPASPRAIRIAAVETAASAAAVEHAAPGMGLTLLLHPAVTVYDGRYANNGWLQELPDPVTTVTWGNPARLSPADARRLGLEDGDVVRLEARGRSLEVPLLVQPGQAEGTVSLALGYGRSTGSVATGVGVDAWPLMGTGSDAAGSPFLAAARLTSAGTRAETATAQMHRSMEGRDIVRSLTLARYAKAGFEQEKREPATLFPAQEFPEHKWGMAIDLTACVGCGGCVVACQSENNVAVVGPEQVRRGRAMHWMRIDRYFDGSPDNPRVVHQPMLCQQCDSAPCETVCPVNATTHSPDGLNQMAYNRCVGTRYCANNCPYKVRRFNFLEYTAAKTEPESLVFNPEVTVRPRGVMEKCTFCVQRIDDVRQRAKGEGRAVRDGEIVPACAAACPATAIVFGDLKDPTSEVSRLAASDRGYRVLEELGVKPSVTYLARLTNPAKGGDGHEG
jgi:MoCo/4Fe-4S cofactor protein with predicted Tat translocation signal